MTQDANLSIAIGNIRYENGKWVEWRELNEEEKAERFDPQESRRLEDRSAFSEMLASAGLLLAIGAGVALTVIKDPVKQLIPVGLIGAGTVTSAISLLYSAQCSKKLLEQIEPQPMDIPKEKVRAVLEEHEAGLRECGLEILDE